MESEYFLWKVVHANLGVSITWFSFLHSRVVCCLLWRKRLWLALLEGRRFLHRVFAYVYNWLYLPIISGHERIRSLSPALVDLRGHILGCGQQTAKCGLIDGYLSKSQISVQFWIHRGPKPFWYHFCRWIISRTATLWSLCERLPSSFIELNVRLMWRGTLWLSSHNWFF